MKMTFLCDEMMIITIPIGMKDMPGGHCMPEKFHCVYRDFYKVFVVNGKPKPLGAAQAIGGVIIIAFTLIILHLSVILILSLLSSLFVVSGLLSYAAGKSPNMHVTKLSFALNIISFIYSVVAIVFHTICFQSKYGMETGLYTGTYILIMVLLVTESFITLYLTYWLSKAVCRQYFNTLPIILLKRGD